MSTEVTEQNKAIAEFMGFSFHDDNHEEFPKGYWTNDHIVTDTIDYDSDWNLIMDCVEKIQSLGYSVMIYGQRTSANGLQGHINSCRIENWDGNDISSSGGAKYGEKINDVHRAVYDFIQWHRSSLNTTLK